MQVRFFEYTLQAPLADLAAKIRQNTDEYIDNILPPLTKALFKYVREGNILSVRTYMGGTAFQKSFVGSIFIFLRPEHDEIRYFIPFPNWVRCRLLRTKKRKVRSRPRAFNETYATW